MIHHQSGSTNSKILTRLSTIVLLAVCFLTADTVKADLLGSWSSFESSGNLASSANASYTTASDIVRGSGITPATTGGLYGAAGFDSPTQNLADAFTWSIANTGSTDMFVDSMNIAFDQFDTPAGSVFTYRVDWVSATGSDFGPVGGGFGAGGDGTQNPIAISSEPIGGIRVKSGGTMDFTFSLWNFKDSAFTNASSIPGFAEFTNSFSDDAVQVFGRQAVPEPSSLALFGIGLTGFVVWRRRGSALKQS